MSPYVVKTTTADVLSMLRERQVCCSNLDDYPGLDFFLLSCQYLFIIERKRIVARKQPKPVHQMSVAEFEKMFPDEDACCAYLVARRWPEGVRCPRCGAENPHKLLNSTES